MGSYFGYAVATTDINNDGWVVALSIFLTLPVFFCLFHSFLLDNYLARSRLDATNNPLQALMCLSLNEFVQFSFVVCRMTDLLVGAPMFMVRGSDSRLEEMGRVYVYLQRGPLNLELHPSHLTGTQVFGRYGSTIAPLGDLNQDGFNGKNGDFRRGADGEKMK